jgi:hypothetical protein
MPVPRAFLSAESLLSTLLGTLLRGLFIVAFSHKVSGKPCIAPRRSTLP